jgi:hypothetical protein
VRESGNSGGYLRVFSYRGVLCKSVEVQGVSEVSFFFIFFFIYLFLKKALWLFECIFLSFLFGILHIAHKENLIMEVFLILDPNGVENGKLIKNAFKHEMRNNQFS